MSAFSHYKLLKNLVGTVFVFCFFFHGLWLTVSRVWPRHTARNRLVLPFIVNPVTVKRACDVKATCREAGNSLEAQSDVFHTAAETSRVILRSTGEELSFVYL